MASQTADIINVTKYRLCCQPGFRQSGMVIKNRKMTGNPKNQTTIHGNPSGGANTDCEGGSVRQEGIRSLNSPSPGDEIPKWFY